MTEGFNTVDVIPVAYNRGNNTAPSSKRLHNTKKMKTVLLVKIKQRENVCRKGKRKKINKPVTEESEQVPYKMWNAVML